MSPPVALFPSLEQAAEPNTPESMGAVLLVEDDESLSDLLKGEEILPPR